MRRPAIAFSAAFGTGIFVSCMMQMEPLIWMSLLTFAVAFFICLKLYNGSKSQISVCMLIMIFAAGGVRLEASDFAFGAYEKDFYAQKYKTGVVTKADEKEDYCSFVLKCGGESYLIRYYGDTDDIYGYIGSGARVRGEIQQPQGKRNPGCFDYGLYLRSCGIGAVIDAQSIEKNGDMEIPLLKITANIKKNFEDRLSQFTDDQTKLLVLAMLFGEKNGLDAGVYEEFQRSGTAHVLAVSGLHVGILYGFFVFLWRGKKGAVFHLATLVLLLLYTLLAEFSPSVVRAAVMIIIYAASGLLRRRYDLLSAAAAAFTAILAAEPYQLFHIGFQLSFLAIASLGVILPFISGFYKGVFLTSAAIQVGMVPYTAFVFNYISLGTVIANVPVVFMAGILLPAAFCLLAVMMLPGEICSAVFGIITDFVETGCDVMIWINRMFYMDGAVTFDVASPPVWLLVTYYGIVFFLLSETGRLMRMRRMYLRIISVAVVVMAVAFSANCIYNDGFHNADIIFVDVGQGSCIHVKTRDGSNYLIDGGGSADYDVGMKTLKPYLLKNGVKNIDAAFVTHLHEDHYGGIRSLAADGMIGKLGVYEGQCILEAHMVKETDSEKNAMELFYLYAGQRIMLDDRVYLEVLAPGRKDIDKYEEILENQDEENEYSLILKLIYGEISVLITGDIDSEGEDALISKWGGRLSCNVMQVPHHGSRYSSSMGFIEAAAPDYAVFQVGRNNYGHPSEEVIQKYEDAGAVILRSDKSGAVGIDISSRGELKVIKMVD